MEEELKKKTFKDLVPGDFVYEIKKDSYNTDAKALKWVLKDSFVKSPNYKNTYFARAEDPNGNRPETVLTVNAGSYGKSGYKHLLFSDRDDAVEEYKKLITGYAREANEEVLRLEKHLELARSRAAKFTERLLKIK